jgi:two-component system response regulator RegX3
MKAKVLVVEDEEALALLAAAYLEREGIDCSICGSGEEARIAFRDGSFDLILLDINLPGMDGFEFLQELRLTSAVPVMVVSARESDEDVITGLSTGADEFVSKPVSPRVLAARVRALLRRSRIGNQPAEPRKIASFGPFILDFDACVLSRGGKRVPLSAREFDVLAFLVDNPGKTYAAQDIYERVWGQRYGDATTIGVYIQRIRKKIEIDPGQPERILTLKGKGYRFNAGAFEGGA